MEPITTTLAAAKEIYEAAKTIQKVYNVSKEMKTVAESEGKDQITATTNLAGTAVDMKQDCKSEKSESKENILIFNENIQTKNSPEIKSPQSDFVDILYPMEDANIPKNPIEKIPLDDTLVVATDFIDTLDCQGLPTLENIPTLEKIDNTTNTVSTESNLFVDKLASTEETDNIALSQNNEEINNSSNEVVERDPNRFSEKNQYADSERCKEYRSNPDNEPLLEGYDKDANILRHNMELVMGDDASEIDRSNSRAHHIVGDNEYSSESKAILEKYGIDINSPENGIFLPQNESSDLHGTIHDGKHTKAYNDEVTQRLRCATCKEDVLEILDSIKEDLYNGDMELYHEHKFNN